MSFYFSVSVSVSTPKLASELSILFLRESRPIFEEDAPQHLIEHFSVIDEIEYPIKLLVSEGRLLIVWHDIESIGLKELQPLFDFDDIELELAYQIDSYAESSDDPETDMDGYFIYLDKDDHVRCNREEANDMFSPELVSRLSNIDKL